MKFLIGCFFSAFLACSFCDLQAQVAPAVLKGRVLAQNGPADGATIILLKYKDSSVVISVSADQTGAFRLNDVQPGNYLLLLSKTGFQTAYSGPYLLNSGQSVTTPDITLKATVKQLGEVSVVGNRPAIIAKPGELIIDVQNSVMAQGNSVFDILRQSPGVRVDNNNNINIIGRQSALITIDDKPTNLTGDDLVAILRSMQANTIDRIELITSGSAKYDASSGGIINIVTKKGKNTGFNGSITGTAGYGRYYKSNVGLVFNDRTAYFNIFGNYSYTDNKTFHDFTIDRKINFDDTLSDYHTDYSGVQQSHVHAFGLGTDFYLSSAQTIGFFINGSVTDDNIAKNNNLLIYNQAALDSTINTNSNLNRDVTHINYNINYKAKLDTMGKTLSADVNYTTNDRSSAEYITNNYYNTGGQLYKDSLLRNLSPSTIHILFSRVDFVDPLSKTSRLEAGLKYSYVTSNNDLIFGPEINGVYTSNPAFTNHFLYTEDVNAAYVNYQDKMGKFNMDVGLRVEQTIAKGNSLTLNQVVNDNYADLFPHALFTYTNAENNQWGLSYSRGITRPGYETLNPFLYYVDPYDYRSGNPNLKPEYSNEVEFSYHYNKNFITTLYTNIISNAYDFFVYDQNDTTKTNITTTKNLGNIYNYGVRFFAPVMVTNWWTSNFDLDASYQRYVAYPQNGNLNKGTQDIIFKTLQDFTITKTFLAEISFHYESPNFYGVNQFKANYGVDAGIGDQLFNNRLSVRLSVTDIFNTVEDRSFTNYQNLDMTINDKKETQVARLTLTYRFGKSSLKATAHHTGNEEEQRRIGGGSEN
jgi:iron complex outermembrane receptor protein